MFIEDVFSVYICSSIISSGLVYYYICIISSVIYSKEFLAFVLKHDFDDINSQLSLI